LVGLILSFNKRKNFVSLTSIIFSICFFVSIWSLTVGYKGVFMLFPFLFSLASVFVAMWKQSDEKK
jgi:hypothetical protein